jgi:hypothetical protein
MKQKHFEDFVHDTLLHHKKIVSGMYRSKQYQIRLRAKARLAVEVKLDKSFRLTGNLFIETDERSSVYDEWRPAGIYHHSQPWLFAVGDNVSFWLFATKTLRNVKEHGDFRQVHNNSEYWHSDFFCQPARLISTQHGNTESSDGR